MIVLVKKNVRKIRDGARETGRAVGKISKRAHRTAKQQSALIIGVSLLIVALLMPAGFGAVYDQLNEMGVNTVVASNSDENSTIYLSGAAYYLDGTNKYTCDLLTVDGYDYFLTGATDTYVASALSAKTQLEYTFNASEAENIDSITIYLQSDDVDFKEINETFAVRITEEDTTVIKSYTWDDFEYDNDTNSFTVDILITPDVLLKLMDDSVFYVKVVELPGEAGDTYQSLFRVIDTKGVSSDGTKNIFLLCGGLLFGGLGVCMTPYVNPMRWINKKMGVR